MSLPIRLHKSGFNLIDKKWGGVYEGGSYLVIGARKSGRTLLGLQFAKASAEEGEVCVYFTNMRPKDLMIQAASLNFDIQKYMDKNLIIVVRVASPEEIYSSNVNDELLIEYLNDIISVSKQYNPQRIVFDELTPYVGFRDLATLKKSFLHLLEEIENRDITSLFVIAEPATRRANEIVDLVVSLVTGVVYLKKDARKIDKKFYGGTVIITPNIGHTEGQFSEQYKILPYKGVVVNLGEENEINLSVTDVREREAEKISRVYDEEADELYARNLHEINENPVYGTDAESGIETEKINNEVARKTETPTRVVNVNASNVYNYNDFSLIINNQIVLFRSTSDKFNIISFAVSIALLETKGVNLDDIKGIIVASTQRREKICYIGDLTMVLVPRSTDERIFEIVRNVYTNILNLGFTKEEAKDLVKLFNYEVDENLDRAETILDYLSSPTTTENLYIPITDFLGE